MSQHIDPEVKQSFIVDNLTTNDAGKALSAAQGKALKDSADILNSKTTTPTVLQVSSYSDFQTQITSTINNMANNEIRSIIIQKTGASDEVFKGATWYGQIGKLTNSYVTIIATTYNGDILRLWLANGTWFYNNVIDTLNSNMANKANKIYVPVPANSSYTVDLTGKVPALVAVGRNNTSLTGGFALIDAWGGLVNLVTHSQYTLSVSSYVLTITNTGNSYASALITY